MHPKTEELLYFLLWTADTVSRPTFRNLTDTYESWAYRNGLLRQIQNLETRRLLEREPEAAPDARVCRLTEKGRAHALGGRDPRERWSRDWDGRWRLVLFDIPTGDNARRERLRRYLRNRTFGCLQNSAWITPDPLESEGKAFAGAEINVKSLILLEARPCAGESDAEIVAAAWDFPRIDKRYERYLKILDERPREPLRSEAAANALRRWAAEERKSWQGAVQSDPLLPERLLPPGYQGKKAWQRRIDALQNAGQQMRAFAP